MVSRLLIWIGWIVCGLIIAGFFFLPWLKFSAGAKNPKQLLVHELKSESERPWWNKAFLITEYEKRKIFDLPLNGVTGYALPLLYATKSARNEVAVLNRSKFFGEARQADRAVLIYIIPVIAFFATLFLQVCPRKTFLLFPLLSCAGIYAFLRWHLDEIYFERLTSNLDLGLGFWIAGYGLLLLSALLLLRIILLSTAKS